MGTCSSDCCSSSGSDASPYTAKKRGQTKTNLRKSVRNTDPPPREQFETMINLEQTTMIDYMLHLSTIQLLNAWKCVDIMGDGEIDIASELHLVFLHLIYDHIEGIRKVDNFEYDHDQRARWLSSELSHIFQSVLAAKCGNHDDEGHTNAMTKHFYLEHFQEYLSEFQSQTQKDKCIEACARSPSPSHPDEDELGRFIIEKLNDDIAEKLILRLNARKKHSASDGHIEARQIIYLLVFISVLCMKYKHKTEECDAVKNLKIDNKTVKQSLMPCTAWILQTKFQQMPSMKKSEYKLLGAWLIEYSQHKSNSRAPCT